ncbi:uncharacterized protein LOC131598304 [Vicia villosa]|uniref:uncharacterized protein LOC131598304 n=1 Tax=Vicia villosa TaxID=3911 RepID=UPI00273B4E7C|nr:uncharacterized protein LOC131598304 [Vicia villosa]
MTLQKQRQNSQISLVDLQRLLINISVVMLLKNHPFVKDLTDQLDTDEQRVMYQKIMGVVDSQNGAVFFLHGYGGTGKTYMWRTLAAALRSKHDICLTVVTSGIASFLLPGGRTAHSKFKIPVPTLDNSTCKIEYNDDVGDLLRQTKLIIWDEAPMAHKHAFEALERTLRDVMSTYSNSKEMFGGKVVVFGGDFKQILPVVPRGSRSDIIHSAINASYIWNSVQVLTLTKNMRLQSGPSENDKNEIQQFSEWLLRIGEGKVSEPNDGVAGDMRDYYSSNSVDKSEINDDTVYEGLCNGTRLIVTKLGTHVIEASIIAGKNCGNQVYIPRMDMSPSYSLWPFKLNRRQFPIIVSYAMTINKSQGQSLDTVGLYLPRDVFTHGQIYVALSRVATKQGIKILIHDQHAKVKTTTTNVVYKEIFSNI